MYSDFSSNFAPNNPKNGPKSKDIPNPKHKFCVYSKMPVFILTLEMEMISIVYKPSFRPPKSWNFSYISGNSRNTSRFRHFEYLGVTAIFFNSVKSSWIPIIQILELVKTKENNFFDPRPPYPLTIWYYAGHELTEEKTADSFFTDFFCASNLGLFHFFVPFFYRVRVRVYQVRGSFAD